MSGMTYIQRVATQGRRCAGSRVATRMQRGKREIVKYQADYIFWAAT